MRLIASRTIVMHFLLSLLLLVVKPCQMLSINTNDVAAADELENVKTINKTWNELPTRYDETQLWRIYNNATDYNMQQIMPLSEILMQKYGGIVWTQNAKFLDISIEREQQKAARQFLNEHHFNRIDVLHDNVQQLFERERLYAARSRTKRATNKFNGMHFNNYHDLSIIYGFLRAIRTTYPNICRLYTIGKTVEGRDLKVLRISENPRAYKKIWIDGGIHAREWISPAAVLYALYQLLTNWDKQPAYLRNITWYFMPVMNPDGYEYSRNVNRLWRKNRSFNKFSECRGVDLNRNFDINWNGYGISRNPCHDIYGGEKAGSELETQAVVEFLSKRKVNLKSVLTFHSYGQYIVYPWAYKAVSVRDASDLHKVANTAVQRIKNATGTTYKAGATYELLGIAAGGSDDWSRGKLGVKYVYTIELRDQGADGFTLPPNQIIGTGKEAWIVISTVAQAVAN